MRRNNNKGASRIALPYTAAAIFVVLSSVLRVFLAVKFHPAQSAGFADVPAWVRVFGVGFLLDILVASAVFFPSVLFFAVCGQKWFDSPWSRRATLGVLFSLWALLVFLFQSEYFFFEEYASRFNTVAIDYLHYWTEVSGNISQVYPWKTVIAISILAAVAITWVLQRFTWPSTPQRPIHRLKGVMAWVVSGLLVFLCAFQVEFQAGSDRLLNELATNGLTSGAIAAWTRELDFAHFYPTLSRDEAFARTRKLLETEGAVWLQKPFSLQRRIPGSPEKPRLNVIVLVQESFGSEFWGCLNMKDGKPKRNSLTPELDKLALNEGFLFTNLFADGNRTVRGLEAIFASFPPLPGDSILARTKSVGCETLASVLARDGYSTTFLYGGRGLFDNMKPFMLNNGFQRFIEGEDFTKTTFSTVWGHCDEDLYQQVLIEARRAHESAQPFFIATMSVSNHQPFKFPPGRVDSKLKGHKSGASYSDFALGQFFRAARNEPFWSDTVFVVVADHGARVYGSQTVPVFSYEIPMLICGPSVVKIPALIGVHGCQLDVAPTILGLIGRPYESVFFGRNLLAPAAARFALLNHNRSVAFFKGEEMTALSLGKVVEGYVRKDRKTLERVPPDSISAESAADATAVFQAASELYDKRSYRVEGDSKPPAK